MLIVINKKIQNCKYKVNLTKIYCFFLKCLENINTLSLDAPLVVLVWQDFFADALGVELNYSIRLVFLLSVWLAYSADRILECVGARSGKQLFKRHLFFYQNYKKFGLIWLIVFITATVISCVSFELTEFFYCLGLFFVVLVNQVWSFFEPIYLKVIPKPFRTSIILAIASVLLPALLCDGLKVWDYLLIFLVTHLFWINCVLSKSWECENYALKDLSIGTSLNIQNLYIGVCLITTMLVFINLSLLFCSVQFRNIGLSLIFSFYFTIILLMKSNMSKNKKRILLDQFYWIIPLCYSFVQIL